MKIAIATDDGATISAHFGRASHYLVVTIEQGKIVSREMRDKLSHNHFAGESHVHESGQPHGFDAASRDRHTQMTASIRDCEAMLCRGMGMGAYESLRSLNIRPILTDIAEADKAVTAYMNGSIIDHTERLH
ncbi:MAG: NifB/NifX family molybdenum-iron cluster-binding protein [Chloroflexi bacterium]|nr:NifB/NifX family molybdenum-iron cluster-binding protein [Chloroflexota bacterium]